MRVSRPGRIVAALVGALLLAALVSVVIVGPSTPRFPPPLGRTERAPAPAALNLPWLCYGHDFGQVQGWTHDGVSSPARARELDETLQAVRAAGIDYVVWFVLGDGRTLPTFDRPLSDLDETGLRVLHADFSAALDALERHGVGVVWVLLDYQAFVPGRLAGRAPLGGRGRLLTDATSRRAFVARVVEPLAARARRSAATRGFVVVNEPEEATTPAQWPIVTRFVDEVCAALRGRTRFGEGGGWRQRCGIASAQLSAIAGWSEHRPRLDFVMVHHYPEARFGLPPTLRPPQVTALRADASGPEILLGEFDLPALPGADRASFVRAIAARGYRNALPWSLRTHQGDSAASGCQVTCDPCIDAAAWSALVKAGASDGGGPLGPQAEEAPVLQRRLVERRLVVEAGDLAKARADLAANRGFEDDKRAEVTNLERLAAEESLELKARGGCRSRMPDESASSLRACERHARELEALLARNVSWLSAARTDLIEARRRVEAAEARVVDHDRKRLDLELLLRDRTAP